MAFRPVNGRWALKIKEGSKNRGKINPGNPLSIETVLGRNPNLTGWNLPPQSETPGVRPSVIVPKGDDGPSVIVPKGDDGQNSATKQDTE